MGRVLLPGLGVHVVFSICIYIRAYRAHTGIINTKAAGSWVYRLLCLGSCTYTHSRLNEADPT